MSGGSLWSDRGIPENAAYFCPEVLEQVRATGRSTAGLTTLVVEEVFVSDAAYGPGQMGCNSGGCPVRVVVV